MFFRRMGSCSFSVGRHTYYVSFIDDFSKYTWIYLLKKRSDVFQVFHNFQALIECKFDTKILAVQSDWGGVYKKLDSFFQQIGISHRVSCPHDHQQNGSVKRKHRHIVEVGLALLVLLPFGMNFFLLAFISSTFFPIKLLTVKLPQNVSCVSSVFTHLFVFLVVHVGQIYAPTTNENLCFVPSSVSFLPIVPNTKESSVLMFLVDGFTSLVM
jgi:hypothetical protein